VFPAAAGVDASAVKAAAVLVVGGGDEVAIAVVAVVAATSVVVVAAADVPSLLVISAPPLTPVELASSDKTASAATSPTRLASISSKPVIGQRKAFVFSVYTCSSLLPQPGFPIDVPSPTSLPQIRGSGAPVTPPPSTPGPPNSCAHSSIGASLLLAILALSATLHLCSGACPSAALGKNKEQPNLRSRRC